MIIDFTIKNFRSIKNSVTLSLEASSSKGKPENVIEFHLKNGKKIRLLRSVVIYGANASGKTNIIRAFFAFQQMIYRSYLNDVNDNILYAEPFLLSTESQKEPTEFTINFVGPDDFQYTYSLSFTKFEGIKSEVLKYYPDHHSVVIFKRTERNVICGKASPIQFEKTFINPKRLFLSEAGNSGNPYWENFKLFFTARNGVFNISSMGGMAFKLTENIKGLFTDTRFQNIAEKVSKLVQMSDLGIVGIDVKEEEVVRKPQKDDDDHEVTYEPRKEKFFKTYHNLYENNKLIGKYELDLLKHGSAGTWSLVGVGGEIIKTLLLEGGRTLWLDEMDNGLHPYLSRFLINLFHHPHCNIYNSQLVFTTHETTLLDKNNFRKDQIWITQKDKFGNTSLFSVYDLEIDGLRQDIPFEKWYLSGKFGGIPKIKELEFIFDCVNNNTDGTQKEQNNT